MKRPRATSSSCPTAPRAPFTHRSRTALRSTCCSPPTPRHPPIVFHYGYDEFFKKCQDVGIDGIILPDLPYEESQEVKDVCYNYDVTLISMIAPTSKDRVEMIAKEAKGFIYLVSSMGVTGTRDNTSFANNLEEIIGHIRQVTNTPVAIGFGINKPEQVKEFKQYADGVIVGSAIVNIIKEHGNHADLPLKEYIQSLTEQL